MVNSDVRRGGGGGGVFFFFQAEDGIRDIGVTGVQTCALPILAQLSDESVFSVSDSCIGTEKTLRLSSRRRRKRYQDS